MENNLLEIITKLVSFKSDFNNLEEKEKIIDYVKEWFLANNIKSEKFFNNKIPYLVAETKGNKEGELYFLQHLDVVPAEEKMFKIKKNDKILKGRGVFDDKGPSAVSMLVLKELLKNKNRPSLKIIFTSDEEVGGENGAKFISQNLDFSKCLGLIVLDGGNVSNIVYKQKGVLHLDLKAQGRSAHGSRPWLGLNAVDEILLAYQKIKDFLQVNNLKENWGETVNLGKIKGGEFANQVPSKAEALIDIRFTEKFTFKKLFDKIKSFETENLKINLKASGEVLHTDKNHMYLKNYKKIIEKHFQTKVAFKGEHGGSDARFFTKFNFPVFIHNANGGGHHSEKEWVDLESLEVLKEVLKEFILTTDF
jgi:succinyl-diaminopimelate desuccinylase